ncbi:LysR family transcriptional regulator [Amycolatopsis echigonensis]|uniref:LysR family transcriptional regulator n=1 Tax=Amycolatopsis echigonensis TaxID=2576905 RepID=A0A8E1VY94_9PSEU|nr:LysR family transcriptional regulator [Amycolatopsis echigonensis]MBB2500512.1 LysR family transcriptional regulator [Amycolatopsis echigonensis]
MDLRLVEYFIAVVDHGSVTKAAQALFIAQPSLSQAIKSLERELGADLFDRTGRALELTGTGRSFEVAARRVLRDVAVARDRVGAVRELRAGQLRISAVADVTLHPLPILVQAFRTRHPDVEVRITDPGHVGGVVAEVRQGHADLGLATLPLKAASLTVRPIGPQRMVLAMTPQLAADLPDPVPQAMLAKLPLIRGVDDRLADLVEHPEALPPARDATVRSGFRQVTWELVRLGAGMAVMPEGIAERQLTGVELRGLDPDIRREVACVYRADQLSPAATAFLATFPLAGPA